MRTLLPVRPSACTLTLARLHAEAQAETAPRREKVLRAIHTSPPRYKRRQPSKPNVKRG